jgi:hypothetical protein
MEQSQLPLTTLGGQARCDRTHTGARRPVPRAPHSHAITHAVPHPARSPSVNFLNEGHIVFPFGSGLVVQNLESGVQVGVAVGGSWRRVGGWGRSCRPEQFCPSQLLAAPHQHPASHQHPTPHPASPPLAQSGCMFQATGGGGRVGC